MGYKQPSARRREHAVKSYNIGVLIAEHWLDKYDSFYLQMYQQVVTRAVAKECFTLMEVVSAQMEAACEMPKLVQEQKADGLIIIGRLTGEYLNFLNEKAYKFSSCSAHGAYSVRRMRKKRQRRHHR